MLLEVENLHVWHGRTHAVRAEQDLEAATLVVVQEPVEDDGVLADMGVDDALLVCPFDAPDQLAAMRDLWR